MGILLLIKQDAPPAKNNRSRLLSLEDQEEKLPYLQVNLEKIYQNDLFDTYTAPEEPEPQKQNFVTPIPEMEMKELGNPPEVKKTEFAPPLKLKIKGIILSHDEEKSIAMVSDQTDKENTYHVGSKIEDAQVIKLTKNKLVLLRSNGQQETYFLRKPEKLNQKDDDKWAYAIKKIDDYTYHIDPEEFKKELDTLGEFIEILGLGTSYQKSSPIGVRVSRETDNNVGSVIGLQQNDIITHVNDQSTSEAKSRIRIFDSIKELKIEEKITVRLLRDGDKKTLVYLLKKLEKPGMFDFLSGSSQDDKKKDDTESELFKLSKSAERAVKRRKFQERHHTLEQQQQAQADMRDALRENMRSRMNKRRVR